MVKGSPFMGDRNEGNKMLVSFCCQLEISSYVSFIDRIIIIIKKVQIRDWEGSPPYLKHSILGYCIYWA